MKALVIGSAGQLGSDLVRAFEAGGHEVTPLTHAEIEVSERGLVHNALAAYRPHVVVNTAAFHQVDRCEDQAEAAFTVNALGALHVAEACAAVGAACVYISTDYVFDGELARPYVETDPVNPVSVYGVSKAAGEQATRVRLDRHYIVRTCGLFGPAGPSPPGTNFIDTMLKLASAGRDLKVVHDQRVSPTYTESLARKIAWLAATESYGTWHITCGGDCSWYEFAQAAFEIKGLTPSLQPTTTEAFGSRARRPAYSVLGHQRLAEAGEDDLPHWRDALRDYLCAKREL